jgi:hypothetical protein
MPETPATNPPIIVKIILVIVDNESTQLMFPNPALM